MSDMAAVRSKCFFIKAKKSLVLLNVGERQDFLTSGGACF